MSVRNQQYKHDTVFDHHIALEEKLAELFPAISYIYYPGSEKIRYLDSKVKEQLGYDYHEIGISELFNVINEDDHEKVRKGIDDAMNLEDKQTCCYQCRLKHRNSTERYFKTTGSVLTRDENGKPTSMLFMAYDVTDTMMERSDAQRVEDVRTNDQINALERSNRELEEFAYAAAHDLQEPLRKIHTFSERLKKKTAKSDDKDSHEYLDRILATCSNMRTLIDSLLDFSKLAHAEPAFEPRDLNDIIEEAQSEVDIKTPGKNIVFNTDDLPVADVIGAEIRQLFINLFTNAIKFQKKDTEPEITVTFERIDNSEKEKFNLHRSMPYLKIKVKDNGIGFESEFAEKIFQPFQRLHGRAEYPGSGIGLAICRKIVEHHRGVIYAESSPGIGATFIIIIPERQLRPV